MKWKWTIRWKKFTLVDPSSEGSVSFTTLTPLSSMEFVGSPASDRPILSSWLSSRNSSQSGGALVFQTKGSLSLLIHTGLLSSTAQTPPNCFLKPCHERVKITSTIGLCQVCALLAKEGPREGSCGENNILFIEGSWNGFALHVNQWFSYKKQTEKIELVTRPDLCRNWVLKT